MLIVNIEWDDAEGDTKEVIRDQYITEVVTC